MLLEADYYSDDRILDTVSGLLFSPLTGAERNSFYDVKDWDFSQPYDYGANDLATPEDLNTSATITFSNKGAPSLYYRFFGDFTFPETDPTWDQVSGTVDYFVELNYQSREHYYDRIAFVDAAADFQTVLTYEWPDLLIGGDEIRGGDNDDVLAGYTGDDILIGGAGHDTLYGGEGLDAAYYAGPLRDYDITPLSNIVDPFAVDPLTRLDGWYIADTQTNRDGDDRVTGVERFYFSDLVLGFDDTTAAAYSLYEAAFNRAPDEEGLGFWIAKLEEGMTFEETSARFIDSVEFLSLYGENPTDGEFLNALYYNILDRKADPEGLDFWLEQMTVDPSKTQAKVLADFALSQENQANLAGTVSNGMLFESWFV
ncbi:MAG: hypothetical protein CMI01_06575 [Oceanospirillaceae bacterium]|nr:hypothetical protein [Oceanospirillaceae bacterium]